MTLELIRSREDEMTGDRWHGLGCQGLRLRSPPAWLSLFLHCSNMVMRNYRSDFYQTYCSERREPAWLSPNPIPGRMSPTSKRRPPKRRMEDIISSMARRNGTYYPTDFTSHRLILTGSRMASGQLIQRWPFELRVMAQPGFLSW